MGPRDPSQGVSRALEALDLLQLATRLLGGIETAYRDVGAGADLLQYFRAMKAAGGAQFKASTAQRFATLADADRQGEHAAAAAWLVRRCELLWSRGYFSKSRESDQEGRPFGIVVLSTLAGDYLSGLQAEGVPELAAMEDLLCALLALRHAAEAARHEPAGKLRPTAVWVAAHATGAWLACHPAVDSLPPLVWDEGGVLEALSAEVAGLTQQCEADPSPAFYKQARMLVSLAATLNKALLNIPKSEVYLAAWRCLLPACMEAGALAGKHSGFDQPPEDLWLLWQALVSALKPLTTVLFVTQLVSSTDASEANLLAALAHLDLPAPYQGLAVLLRQLVNACARVPHQEALNAQEYSAYTEVSFGLPAWWKTTNDSLVDVLVLEVSLAGQREFQVEAFLASGGMAAIHRYLEFWGPQANKQYNEHPRMHHHAGQLLELAAYCMAGVDDGQAAQEMFGYEGVTLCLAALENMLEPDLLVIDPTPDRWSACKSLLRALECACHMANNVNKTNCFDFVEEGGVEEVIAAILPHHAPPSESLARQNQHWRTTSLMRNGVSLLASLVDASYDAQMDDVESLGEAFVNSLVGALEAAFEQQGTTLSFGLMRLVQWGIAASLGDGPKPGTMSAQACSAHSLLSGALTLLYSAAEHNEAVLEAVASSPAYLATLQRAGQQYLVRREDCSRQVSACRAWLETLGMFVRLAPSCQDELLSKGLFKTAGGVLQILISDMQVVHKASSLEAVPELIPELEALTSSLQATDAAQAFQNARRQIMEAQGRAVESAAEIFIALNAQCTPASVRCSEALLAAAGPSVDLDSPNLPIALQMLRAHVRASRDMIARQHRRESAELAQKAKEAEAAFAALMADEEQVQQKQAAAQAKKAAKRQKQKQRAAAEREAAAAAAAAEAEAAAAQQAAQQRRRQEDEEQWQQAEQQQVEAQQAVALTEAGGSKKKKKKKKGQAAEPAGPGAAAPEQQDWVAGSPQQQLLQQQAGDEQQAAGESPEVQPLEPAVHAPAAVAGLSPPGEAAAFEAAAGRHEQEPEDELQDLLAHLLPSMYPSSASSSTAVTPDVPLVGAPVPGPPPPPPHWLEQQQQGQQSLSSQQQPGQHSQPPPQQQQQQGREQREWECCSAQLRAVLSCPLTGGMLSNPVILSDGHSYERHAAEAWLASNSCSPLTGEALDTSICRPNHALRQLIEKFA